MKLHSFVQVELRIKNALMNAQQQLSLKKLPDLIEHPKTETDEWLFVREKCEWRGKVKFDQLVVTL